MRDDVLVFERMSGLFAFGQSVLARYSAIGGSMVAGGIAFYVFFALAPTAVAVGAVAGLFVSQQQVEKVINEAVSRSPETLQPLEPALKALVQLADRGSSGTLTVTTIASIFLATYVASRVVYGLRSTLTRMFGAPERIHGLVDRGFSAVVALGGIIGLVALLLVLQVLPRILDALGLLDVEHLVGARVVNWTVLTVGAFTVIGAVLKFLPDADHRVRFRSWGVVFATLWMLGSSAVFGLYTSLSNTVGSAIVVFGAPIVLLLWLYLAGVGVLLGAAVEAQRAGVDEPPRPEPLRLPASVTRVTGRITERLRGEPSGRPGDESSHEAAESGP